METFTSEVLRGDLWDSGEDTYGPKDCAAVLVAVVEKLVDIDNLILVESSVETKT